MRRLAYLALLPLLSLPSARAAESGGSSVTRVGSEEVRPIAAGAGEAKPGSGPRAGINAGRIFMGGGLGYSLEIFSGELDSVNWKNAWNLDLKGGYFLAEWLALEVVGGYAGPFAHEYDLRHSTYRDYLNVFSLTGNLKLLLPAGDKFALYAVGGAGYGWGRIDWDYGGGHYMESGPWGRGGLGMNFYAEPNAALELEVTYNTGFEDLSDLHYVALTANALWIF